MAIYPVEDELGETRYVIASHQVWRPGSYDSQQAARYAFRFSDDELAALQATKRQEAITMDDLSSINRTTGD